MLQKHKHNTKLHNKKMKFNYILMAMIMYHNHFLSFLPLSSINRSMERNIMYIISFITLIYFAEESNGRGKNYNDDVIAYMQIDIFAQA